MSDEEFLRAVGEHLDLVYNLARRLARSRPQAEDLVQETYLRALRGWRRRRPDDVRAWLATICLNAARAGYRRDAAGPAEVLDPDAGSTVASAPRHRRRGDQRDGP
jgi:RNA polymerase sigma-70 factor (ECF subfamily)